MLVSDLIKHLQTFDQNTYVASLLWMPEDVMSRAEERSMALSEVDAKSIIQEMDHRKDAEIGLNWDVIDVYLDEYTEGGPE